MDRRSIRLWLALQDRLRSERGDVPGWVLVTLMSALIVAALWTFARNALISLFDQAMNTVR